MYFKVTDQFNERWESDWITGAFWHALNLGLNVVICFLWRPSEAAMQYAYGADMSDELDLEDLVPFKAPQVRNKQSTVGRVLWQVGAVAAVRYRERVVLWAPC
jgi:hypothetical protein